MYLFTGQGEFEHTQLYFEDKVEVFMVHRPTGTWFTALIHSKGLDVCHIYHGHLDERPGDSEMGDRITVRRGERGDSGMGTGCAAKSRPPTWLQRQNRDRAYSQV